MNAAFKSLGIILGIVLLLAFQKLLAQGTPVLINAEARLETVLALNITPDTYVEFGIKKINDNLYQITKQPEDIMFSVESTSNWDLSISAENPYFRGIDDTTLKIPLDFVGLYIENRGENWDNGLFSNIANVTKDSIVFLSNEKTMLLENGRRTNIGGATHNSFILRWKFFYEDDALKIQRFSKFNITDDNYTVGFYITLSESSP